MADINVDVILSSPIQVDVNSQSQYADANIFFPVPGPQGPPTQLNNISSEKIYISGKDGINVYNSGTNTIFISGYKNELKAEVDNLSGYFEQENIIGYSVLLSSGFDNYYIHYPAPLESSPKSITCVFQNTIDDMFYYFNLGSMDSTGFNINFSDILIKDGYFLKIQVKK